MSHITVKTHYSAAELAAMKLPGLPGTQQNILLIAKSEGWEARRKSKGKGSEFALTSLPTAAQTAIKQAQAKTLLAEAKSGELVTTREARVARREEQLV